MTRAEARVDDGLQAGLQSALQATDAAAAEERRAAAAEAWGPERAPLPWVAPPLDAAAEALLAADAMLAANPRLEAARAAHVEVPSPSTPQTPSPRLSLALWFQTKSLRPENACASFRLQLGRPVGHCSHSIQFSSTGKALGASLQPSACLCAVGLSFLLQSEPWRPA